MNKKTAHVNGRDVEFTVTHHYSSPLLIRVTTSPVPARLLSRPYDVTRDIGMHFDPGYDMPKYCAYMADDTKTSKKVLADLEALGIVKPYKMNGKQVTSTYAQHEYKMYQFSKEKLLELDAKGTLEYDDDYTWEADLIASINLSRSHPELMDRRSSEAFLRTIYGEPDSMSL